MNIKTLLISFSFMAITFCGYATDSSKVVNAADLTKEARLLRFPSVGGDNIVFTYAGDLYKVGINGGRATKLTSDIGYECFSRISPDGKTIAFTGQYDGNTEVYTLPIEGGTPTRITYSAEVPRDQVGERMGPNNIVMCWTPDGKEIVYRTKWYCFSGMRGLLYKVSKDGGDPKVIPSSEGGFCSYSPDGKTFAFNRMFREFRTWKYYRGGEADEIWLHKVGTTEIHAITHNDAQDIFPMWIGKDIYFLSDRDHTMNLFCYDTTTKQTTKITNFDDYDIKFPSFSQNYIVFENAGFIYKYSIKDKKISKVNITLSNDNIYSRPKFMANVKIDRRDISISPDGKRVLATARGDIFSLPATQGVIYNLTQTPGAHDKDANWSPDGKYIAFFSDKSGEYQLYLASSSDPYKQKQMTDFKTGYPTNITWTSDSKKIIFKDEKNNMYSLDIQTKKLKTLFHDFIRGFVVSPNNKYIAYSSPNESKISTIKIYDIKNNKSHEVTSRWFNSYSPIFSSDGKYLFYQSSTDISPIYSDVEWNTAISLTYTAFVLPLQKEATDPTLLSSDEYTPKSEESSNKDDKKANKKAEEVNKSSESVIDFDDIINRSKALPIKDAYLLGSVKGDLLYMKGRDGVKKLSLKNMKESTFSKDMIVAHNADYSIRITSKNGKYYVSPSSNMSAPAKPIPTDNISLTVDYHKEWTQIFNETWRIDRDYFYQENMHGADWNKIKTKYSALLPYVNHRTDLTYIISEMISEFCSGHSYCTTGEAPHAKKIKTGLLGGKFVKDAESGAFKITHIFADQSWNKEARSPLGSLNDKVKVGDYIIAINNIPTSQYSSIYQPLIGKADQIVSLTISPDASSKDAKTYYVKPVASETQLAYYEWVKGNIKKVSDMSNGQIGYIHIPDMGLAGLTEFTKLFYTQLDKKALIIDDRMNGGGNISPMVLERLNRKLYGLTMGRNRPNGRVPEQTFYGPKVVLVDKYSASDGDLFPYRFQKAKMGKVIGKRTWGGIIGISGSKKYLDGQDVRTPFFTNYSLDGKWIVENHGVDPDIDIDINPFEDFLGNDAQLNKAVEVLLEEMKNYKPLPDAPAAPNRFK